MRTMIVLALAGCSGGTSPGDIQPQIVGEWGDEDVSYPNALAFSAEFQIMNGDTPTEDLLSSDYRVTLTFQNTTTELTNGDDEDNNYGYFPPVVGDPSGSEIDVELRNGDNALHSTVTMPPDFTIDPITAPMSRSAPLVVTWSPSSPGDTISISMEEGDCITAFGDGQTMSFPDTGTWTAPTLTGDGTCNLSFTFERARRGTLAPGFHSGGEILGIQSHTLGFQSVP